ncbi:LysR family transcriptional regulator [Salinarimonas ramus]|uniref:LysR family transcriptional regulator n=1 Tax=Salinarimonas ramus TaxID=690164 RepID=A0A917QAZ3_9HYPH|nr:LysR family transcriptional regulator [Salinarimonas ramus]GGK40698.1 LysR family transcriptional regulator [Salinarimonas ramus]
MAEDLNRIDWDDLRLFLVVARMPSLRVAADVLGVSAATLSRHVATLEQRLGTPLFLRRSRGLELSREGEALFARCEEIERIVGRAAELDVGASRFQEVHLGCVPALARLIVPALPRFATGWPDLRLVLAASAEVGDFEASEVDIAVRLTRPKKGRFTVRRVASMPLSVWGRADGPADRPLVLWGPANGHASRLDALVQERAPDRRVAFVTNELSSFVGALRAGLGQGVLPDVVAREHPELVRMDGFGSLPEEEVWIVTREEARRRASVRQLATFLGGVLSDALRPRARRPIAPGMAIPEAAAVPGE